MAPDELVYHARDVGLTAMALTDHDRIDGVPVAIEAAKDTGLLLIPGIELSSFQDSDLHILGYFNENNYVGIQKFLDRAVQERAVRNEKIINKLNSLGLKITEDEVRAEAGKNIYGRLHIAATMVEKGYVHSTSEAFSSYLAFGRKAYVVKEFPTADMCVRAIKEAGGLPVLAHPVSMGMKLKKLRVVLDGLIRYGLEGIEAYYPDNKPADTEKYLALAVEYGLIATGGSDFHGDYRKYVRLGYGRGNLTIPDKVLYDILARLG
jgi:predicted metal-dependent phosphoesterase TrpH